MRTFTLVRPMMGFRGLASLYTANPPVKYSTWDYEEYETSYVIASSVTVDGIPETLVFPANEYGKLLSGLEIAGGRGDLTHRDALCALYATD